MARYRVLRQQLRGCFGARRAFGVFCGGVGFRDLSDSRAAVQQFVRRLNRGKLQPQHFGDAVEDFLAEGGKAVDKARRLC